LFAESKYGKKSNQSQTVLLEDAKEPESSLTLRVCR